MSRNVRQSIDYIVLDAGMRKDAKILRLMHAQGREARMIYVDLLLWIAAGKGYYMPADDDELYAFADFNDYSIDEVVGVVNACVEIGLFDAQNYVDNSVITSQRIQEAYSFATKKRRIEYALLPFWMSLNAICDNSSTSNDSKSTFKRQKKEKKRKEKESKETPANSSGGKLDIRSLISDEFFQDLSEKYGQSAILILIARMERYCQQHDKTYQDYEAAIEDWALKDLKPIPSWTTCTNPECNHGIVYFNDETTGELLGKPCPICKRKEVERGAP